MRYYVTKGKQVLQIGKSASGAIKWGSVNSKPKAYKTKAEATKRAYAILDNGGVGIGLAQETKAEMMARSTKKPATKKKVVKSATKKATKKKVATKKSVKGWNIISIKKHFNSDTDVVWVAIVGKRGTFNGKSGTRTLKNAFGTKKEAQAWANKQVETKKSVTKKSGMPDTGSATMTSKYKYLAINKKTGKRRYFSTQARAKKYKESTTVKLNKKDVQARAKSMGETMPVYSPASTPSMMGTRLNPAYHYDRSVEGPNENDLRRKIQLAISAEKRGDDEASERYWDDAQFIASRNNMWDLYNQLSGL